MNIHSPCECHLMTSLPNRSARSSTQTSFKGTSVSRSTSKKQSWASSSPSCASSNSMRTSLFFTRLRVSINNAGVRNPTIQMMTSPLRPSTRMTSPQSARLMKELFGCVLSLCVQRHWLAILTPSRKTMKSSREITLLLTKATARYSAPVKRKFFTSWWTWATTCSIC